MSNTTPIVTIFGGSGFVGRYIAHRMARAGWRVRVAVRRPNEAMYVKTYGTVGQVEPILANVRNEASIRRAISGADAVVNCVGIMQENHRQKFDAVHSEAAGSIAKISTEEGITRLVHLSAIGADANSSSEYARTKAAGESLVLKGFPDATIMRPSVIFGTEDKFLNRFARMSMISPIIPLVGADTRFQPVYVDDVAAAVEVALIDGVSGTFELGGPDIVTLREAAELTLDVIKRKRITVEIPVWFARMKAWGLDLIAKWTRGLVPALLTRDQVKMLQIDNVVADDAAGLSALGITPTAMETVVDDYLYCFRSSGQFTAITASGKNLKA